MDVPSTGTLYIFDDQLQPVEIQSRHGIEADIKQD